MQRRYIVPFGTLCLGLPVLVFLFPRLMVGGPTPDSIGPFENWSPSVDTIRAAVGAGPGGVCNDSRHTQFARMFQQRFRDNQKAVGVSFASEHRIKAKFAATIPRWDMASVAMELHREASEVFGRSFEIDLYETYISLAPRKLAELREPANGKRIGIVFDPKFQIEVEQRERMESPALPLMVFSPGLAPAVCPNPIGWAADARQEQRRKFLLQRAAATRDQIRSYSLSVRPAVMAP